MSTKNLFGLLGAMGLMLLFSSCKMSVENQEGSNPLTCSFTANPNPGTVGQAVIFSFQATGGVAPYSLSTFAVTPSVSPLPLESQTNLGEISVVFSSPGSRSASATITDNQGSQASCSLTFNVNGTNQLSVPNLTLSASPGQNVKDSQTIQIQAQAPGFNGGTLNYSFSTQEPGVSVQMSGNTATVSSSDGADHDFVLRAQANDSPYNCPPNAECAVPMICSAYSLGGCGNGEQVAAASIHLRFSQNNSTPFVDVAASPAQNSSLSQSIILNASVKGMPSPIQYAFNSQEPGINIHSTNGQATITVTDGNPHLFWVQVQANQIFTCAAGEICNTPAEILYSTSILLNFETVEATGVTVSASSNSIVGINQNITLSAQAYGFTGPVGYQFQTTEPGIKIAPNGNQAVVSVTDGQFHNFTVQVIAEVLGEAGTSIIACPAFGCGGLGNGLEAETSISLNFGPVVDPLPEAAQ